MIRVLNVIGSLQCGGAETTVMNYYRSMNRSQVQFDFLISSRGKNYYEDEAVSLGARVFRRPMRSRNPIGNMMGLIRVIRSNPEIRIVHIHCYTPISAIDLLLAMLCRIPVRIAHSRSAPARSSFLRKAFQPLFRVTATHRIGCSTEAGISMFGHKAQESGKIILIPNARDLDPFRYNLERHKDIRRSLGLSSQFVLVHIGRMDKVKNHDFLLEAFACAIKKDSNLILLLAGDGELHTELRNHASVLGLEKSVRFLGHRDDVPNLLQAADLFVLPSLHEGLPGSAIEAQATGLPCLLADTISLESKITDLVEFLPIDKGPEIWAERMLEYRGFVRRDTIEVVSEAGYDVNVAAKRLGAFYIEELEKYCK